MKQLEPTNTMMKWQNFLYLGVYSVPLSTFPHYLKHIASLAAVH